MSYITELGKYLGHDPILTAGVVLFVFNNENKVLMQLRTDREYPNGDKLYDITAIYIIKRYHGDLKINDDESKKIDWFYIDNLPTNITPYIKNKIVS